MSDHQNTPWQARLTVIVATCSIAWAFGCCAGSFSGHYRGTQDERAKAVEAGVGRWVIDPATGVKSFEYGVEKCP
jgi:hypothetical protein